MKKITLFLLVLAIAAIPVLAFVPAAYAGNFRSSDNAVVKEDEIIDHTLFIAGNNVEVNGEVKGDIFCAGQNITINAKVSGDVLCAGMTVRVGGTVEGDVRLAGQVVVLSGTVSHNASLAGSTITTDQTSKIGGDLHTIGGTTTINGEVARDIDVAGETITVNTKVGRDIEAKAKNLSLGANANIIGNITYYSNQPVQKTDQTIVGGKITQKEVKDDEHTNTNPMALNFASTGIFLAMTLVLALVIAALFPRMLQTVTDNAISKPGTTALIGLASSIAVPIVIIGSFLTIIGILLGITLLLFWLVVALLSTVLFSYYLGRLVFRRTSQHPLLIMLVGVLIVAILLLIPIIDVLTVIAAMLFGSGMVIRELFTRTPKPVYAAAKSKK